MSHDGGENPGTGPREIFEMLVKAPRERLLSLTIQLGESTEDNIICALCLIILQREAQAMDKLQMLQDNSLATHLAEKWHSSEGKLADFGFHCSEYQASTRDSLAELARMFKVLSEQRLCDPLLRNLAYKRALSINRHGSCEEGSYDRFREEAKDVCGPEFAEWTCSSEDLQSDIYCSPDKSMDEANTTLRASVSQSSSASTHCLPSPLQASLSMPSYPTHLEISIPATISFQGDRMAPEASGNPQTNTPLENNAPGPSQVSDPQSELTGSPSFGAKSGTQMNDMLAAMTSGFAKSIQIGPQTNQPGSEPTQATATDILLPKTSASRDTQAGKYAEEEEEEDTFYDFVILHAPEDTDMAESMKDKVEAVVSCDGATFSEDFETPGKSIFRCLEDSIKNSGFVILLLTQNFNTRLLDLKTNTALINSIKKEPKYNTVIPLLPKQNCMTRTSIPMVLDTLIKLEENKYFEKKIKKFLTPANLKRQRREWDEEQKAKMQRQRKENGTFVTQGNPPQVVQEQVDGRHLLPASICIQNAQYIMIGNDSTMTVSGSADRDESVFNNKEQ